MSDMAGIKERLIELMEQQCTVIEEMSLVVSAQGEAIGRDAFDEVQALDQDLTNNYELFDRLQQEIEAVELDLVAASQGLTVEQLAAEIPRVLELRALRLERLNQQLAQQQTFRNSLLKQLEGLTQDSRQLGQTLQAFHGYRNAAQLNPRVLDVKK